ncbi:23S rRNA (uracil(1939)-C(5))-methyltransferase RlmD [Paenibacillus yanchengensis]|uniref:23S rRNA (Uracil(1939)-C(5))-methyltransferase RlmD n=1 Tax=Paenibacillus yanchengensis TaxID=2035833 RepID=A0ABW4YFJ6_9BACL
MKYGKAGRHEKDRNKPAKQTAGKSSMSRRRNSRNKQPSGVSGASAVNNENSVQPAALAAGNWHANDIVEVDIVDLTHEGQGVARLASYPLFVSGTIPGDRWKVKLAHLKKSYGFAEPVELLSASPSRISAPCAIFDQCGGCQLQQFDYEQQLVWKRQLVVNNLLKIGKLNVVKEESTVEVGEQTGVIVRPTIRMAHPWKYRNKSTVPVGREERTGQLIAGFYERGSHEIVDMDHCLIQNEPNDEAVRVVKQIAKQLQIEPYDERTRSGLLRHIMVRSGEVTGEMMVVLITNGRIIPQLAEWLKRIRKELPQVTSIVQNINERNTNVIFGEQTITLWGSDIIYDELDGIRFAISARSFFQVNPKQTIALYQKAVEYAALTGQETVIDAYCGIGTISLFLARQAAHVYGVEIVPEAIEDAKRNAGLNSINNTTFAVGAAEQVMPAWKQQGITADVIVVDPPRKGCDPILLETIIQLQPKRVVYVSCNPSTLARDLRILEDGGYRIVEATPVDMFAWTSHVESVVSMHRVDK